MDLTGIKLGIVMPVWMQEKSVLEMTKQTLLTMSTKAGQVTLYIVPSRLKEDLVSAVELQRLATDWCGYPVVMLYTPGLERTVAGCWNAGCEAAFQAGADFALIHANDVRLKPDSIDKMLEFGGNNHDVDLWSGFSTHGFVPPFPTGVGDSADFSFFMIRPSTFAKYGTFDARFKPAYFEDNDYYGRVILGGGRCAHVYDAQVDHLGSQTIKLDPEAAHHNNHWFGINQRRFLAKWRTPRVANNPQEVLDLYAKNPWGDPTKTIAWWDQE